MCPKYSALSHLRPIHLRFHKHLIQHRTKNHRGIYHFDFSHRRKLNIVFIVVLLWWRIPSSRYLLWEHGCWNDQQFHDVYEKFHLKRGSVGSKLWICVRGSVAFISIAQKRSLLMTEISHWVCFCISLYLFVNHNGKLRGYSIHQWQNQLNRMWMMRTIKWER